MLYEDAVEVVGQEVYIFLGAGCIPDAYANFPAWDELNPYAVFSHIGVDGFELGLDDSSGSRNTLVEDV